MKPSLQLNITQHLTLTPQLQQAIRLLQLSTLDLQQEIQQVVDSNPLLDACIEEDKEEPPHEDTSIQDEFIDYQWSSLYGAHKNNHFNENDNFENIHYTTTNLQDHLRWQLELTPMSDIDRMIATAIIDAVNEDGFLTQSPNELQTMLTSDAHRIDLDEIEMVRHRLQHFDPIGCAAINLSEVLLAQLNEIPQKSAEHHLAKKIIQQDLLLLAQHNYRQLLKNYQLSETTLHEVLRIIQNLTPRPGSLLSQGNTEYVIPDITVKKVNNHWQVALNQYSLPKLSINHYYASLIQHSNNSIDNQFLKTNLQEARWFLKSIESRQDTLLKVACCIVDHQIDFFEHGEEAMKPLVLNAIAEKLNMHESTISRITTQKFMHTPRGIFELKYFFCSHVTTSEGEECSAIAVRAMIKKIIAAENHSKPLSDHKIAALIAKDGIPIARRTVAKYREALGIASSSERKIIDVSF